MVIEKSLQRPISVDAHDEQFVQCVSPIMFDLLTNIVCCTSNHVCSMPTEKPIRQKLTLSNLATTRPSEPLGAEQPAIASTKTGVLGAKPPVSLEEDAPTVSRLRDKKLEYFNNELNTLESTTNASDEVFKPGDKIRVKAPWGDSAIAEIVTLYQDSSGSNWAYYIPFEPSLPPNWSWLGGCTRASLLVKSKQG